MRIATSIEGNDRRIAGVLAEHVEAVVNMRPDVNLDALRTFMRGVLVPHLHAEELHILPEVEGFRVRAAPPAMATDMDLQEIKRCIHQIESQVFALETAPTEDVAAILWADLKVFLIELQALVRLHMRKIEGIYAPILDERLTNAQKHRTIADMEAEERLEALA